MLVSYTCKLMSPKMHDPKYAIYTPSTDSNQNTGISTSLKILSFSVVKGTGETKNP